MKARIRKTGEIIDFLGSSIEYGTCTWIDSKGDFNQGPSPGIEILEAGKPIDWEQRRYEIARSMMAAFMSNSCSNVYGETVEQQAKDAVKYADALIEELKRQENETD